MTTSSRHIIEKFRDMLQKRYQYAVVKQRFELPDTITPEVVADIESYFLSTIYPPAEERERIETTFRHLADYIRQPKKMWNLFGSMSRAVFRYGIHFPAAVKTGINALESYVGAKKFETSMADIANQNGILPPISDDDFEDCVYQLPREDLERFIEDVRNLFAAMVNAVLLSKTIEILEGIVETMRKSPSVYDAVDIAAIQLGISMLQRGYDLFSKYDEATKKIIVEHIYLNEYWFLDTVYRKKEGE